SGPSRRNRSVRSTASLAQAVLWEARHGQPRALGIVGQAQRDLVRLTQRTLARLKTKKRLPVAVAGGLFENRFFREGFYSLLDKRVFGKAERGRNRDAARTAARIALSLGATDAPLGLADEFKEVTNLR